MRTFVLLLALSILFTAVAHVQAGEVWYLAAMRAKPTIAMIVFRAGFSSKESCERFLEVQKRRPSTPDAASISEMESDGWKFGCDTQAHIRRAAEVLGSYGIQVIWLGEDR